MATYACNICSLVNSAFRDDPLVRCCNLACNIIVHRKCYGIVNLPGDGEDWTCSLCQLHICRNNVKCELCPARGGAFKMTTDNKFVHLVCSIHIPEVMLDESAIDSISLEEIPAERFKQKCYICVENLRLVESRMGASMSCCQPECDKYFHATCGQLEDLLRYDGDDDVVNDYLGFCEQHIGFSKDPLIRTRLPNLYTFVVGCDDTNTTGGTNNDAVKVSRNSSQIILNGNYSPSGKSRNTAVRCLPESDVQLDDNIKENGGHVVNFNGRRSKKGKKSSDFGSGKKRGRKSGPGKRTFIQSTTTDDENLIACKKRKLPIVANVVDGELNNIVVKDYSTNVEYVPEIPLSDDFPPGHAGSGTPVVKDFGIDEGDDDFKISLSDLSDVSNLSPVTHFHHHENCDIIYNSPTNEIPVLPNVLSDIGISNSNTDNETDDVRNNSGSLSPVTHFHHETDCNSPKDEILILPNVSSEISIPNSNADQENGDVRNNSGSLSPVTHFHHQTDCNSPNDEILILPNVGSDISVSNFGALAKNNKNDDVSNNSGSVSPVIHFHRETDCDSPKDEISILPNVSSENAISNFNAGKVNEDVSNNSGSLSPVTHFHRQADSSSSKDEVPILPSGSSEIAISNFNLDKENDDVSNNIKSLSPVTHFHHQTNCNSPKEIPILRNVSSDIVVVSDGNKNNDVSDIVEINYIENIYNYDIRDDKNGFQNIDNTIDSKTCINNCEKYGVINVDNDDKNEFQNIDNKNNIKNNFGKTDESFLNGDVANCDGNFFLDNSNNDKGVDVGANPNVDFSQSGNNIDNNDSENQLIDTNMDTRDGNIEFSNFQIIDNNDSQNELSDTNVNARDGNIEFSNFENIDNNDSQNEFTNVDIRNGNIEFSNFEKLKAENISSFEKLNRGENVLNNEKFNDCEKNENFGKLNDGGLDFQNLNYGENILNLKKFDGEKTENVSNLDKLNNGGNILNFEKLNDGGKISNFEKLNDGGSIINFEKLKKDEKNNNKLDVEKTDFELKFKIDGAGLNNFDVKNRNEYLKNYDEFNKKPFSIVLLNLDYDENCDSNVLENIQKDIVKNNNNNNLVIPVQKVMRKDEVSSQVDHATVPNNFVAPPVKRKRGRPRKVKILPEIPKSTENAFEDSPSISISHNPPYIPISHDLPSSLAVCAELREENIRDTVENLPDEPIENVPVEPIENVPDEPIENDISFLISQIMGTLKWPSQLPPIANLNGNGFSRSENGRNKISDDLIKYFGMALKRNRDVFRQMLRLFSTNVLFDILQHVDLVERNNAEDLVTSDELLQSAITQEYQNRQTENDFHEEDARNATF